jgi:hypothetical protein
MYVLCNDVFDRLQLTVTTGTISVNNNGRHLCARSEERREKSSSLDDVRALL